MVVVVSRAEVGVALESAFFATYHQAALAMGLEAAQAVHHVHPHLFHLAGPLDIGGFVEAGLQLD